MVRSHWLMAVFLGLGLIGSGCGNAAKIRLDPRVDPESAPISREELDAEYRAMADIAYAQGVYLRELGARDAALERFSHAVSVYPRAASLRMAVVEMQLILGRTNDALEFLRGAVAKFEGSEEEFLLLARLFLARGRVAEGLENLEAAVLRAPNSAVAWNLKGRFHFDQKEFHLAVEALSRADRLEPKDIEVLDLLSQAQAVLGNVEKAEAIYHRILKLNSLYNPTRIRLGNLYKEQGRNTDAEALFLEALRLKPDDGETLGAILDFYISTHKPEKAAELLTPYHEAGTLTPRQTYVYGSLLVGLKRFEEGERVFIPLSKLEGVRGIESILGELAMRENRLQEAREHFELAVKENPRACKSYSDLLMLLSRELRLIKVPERYESTTADSLRFILKIASKIAGEDFRCNVLLGVAYAQLREFKSAIVHLEIGRSVNPENTDLLFNLAMAHEEEGNFEAALQYGNDILEADPENHVALNFVGYIMADHGVDLEDSAILIQKALVQEPENGYYVDSLGWVFYQMGNYERAAAELERAVQLTQEEDPKILEHLGDAYRETGDLDGAYKVYLRSRALDSASTSVLEKIDALENRTEKP